MNLVQLAFRDPSHLLELPAELAPEYPLSFPVPERPDHVSRILPERG